MPPAPFLLTVHSFYFTIYFGFWQLFLSIFFKIKLFVINPLTNISVNVILALFKIKNERSFDIKICLCGETDEVMQGITLLAPGLKIEPSGEGKSINIKKCEHGFKIISDGNSAEIFFNTKTDFFRALSLTVDSFKNKKELRLEQKPSFDSCGSE